MAMEIILNGKEKTISPDLNIEKLLEQLKVNQLNVVIELNLDILDKNKYNRITLKENDKVEIVHFVGGG